MTVIDTQETNPDLHALALEELEAEEAQKRREISARTFLISLAHGIEDTGVLIDYARNSREMREALVERLNLAADIANRPDLEGEPGISSWAALTDEQWDAFRRTSTYLITELVAIDAAEAL